MIDGSEILGPNELAGATAEKAAVTSSTGASLEALKQSVAPTVGPAIAIAGIAYITYLGIRSIITGQSPLKSKG
ncbi:MAG: hypothetical protein K9M03_02910 [Kiritimatiellales bacterium]|nr:hypothetical protein [Kiritimatiellales bacterium]